MIAAWAAVLLTALAVATVVIVEVVSDEAPVEQTVAEAVPVADEATALARLVAHGYIPREALEPIRDVTDDLVNRGLVPNRAWHAPLYSQEELVTLQLVRSGDLPVETTQSDDWVTRRLIARGQIPRAAAD